MQQLAAGPFLLDDTLRKIVGIQNPDGTVAYLSGGPAGYINTEKALSRISNPAKRDYAYSFLPDCSARGKYNYNPNKVTYFDSAYNVGDSDGTISKPFNTLLFRDMNEDDQVFALKRGSVFFVASERDAVTNIRGKNCSVIAYGDESLPNPIVFGARSFPGTEFAADGSEFSRTISRSLSHNFDYVAFSDDLYNPLVRGTAVGSLSTGQYIYSGGKLYVKDNPGSTRNVVFSMTRRVFAITGSAANFDNVEWGGSSNHGAQATFDPVLDSVGPVFRDTRSWFCGNNGIEIGENARKCNDSVILRHTDVGSRNNGINGSGDDGGTYVIDTQCYGVIRASGDTYGYSNDAITAHGTEGVRPWYVVGCVASNSKEDLIDIIGTGSGGVIHRSSVIAFNIIRKSGESGVYAWCYNPIVVANDISDTQWAPIQCGSTTAGNTVIDGLIEANLLYDGAKSASTSNSSGVDVGGKGVTVRRNTMIRRAGAQRALMQFENIAALESGTVEANLFILEDDASVINTNTSSGATIKTLTWRDNYYVIPAANVVVPFATGGTPKTFAQWKTDVEITAQLATSQSAAGIEASTYAATVDSPLRRYGRGPLALDYDGQYRFGQVGARHKKI